MEILLRAIKGILAPQVVAVGVNFDKEPYTVNFQQIHITLLNFVSPSADMKCYMPNQPTSRHLRLRAVPT